MWFKKQMSLLPVAPLSLEFSDGGQTNSHKAPNVISEDKQ